MHAAVFKTCHSLVSLVLLSIYYMHEHTCSINMHCALYYMRAYTYKFTGQSPVQGLRDEYSSSLPENSSIRYSSFHVRFIYIPSIPGILDYA